jgi:adenosylhomocysteine nucleosidase
MKNEYDLAQKYAAPGTLVLTGIQTVADLNKNVPRECKAIMSFGMSGGLRPGLPVVGQTVLASYLVGPNGEHYTCDKTWCNRLFAQTKFYVQPYYSSGQFNQANTPEQRAAIYKKTGAWCIDDESLWVAQFAKARGIPFVIGRNVSDQWNDDVSITSNILNANGGADVEAVIKDLFTDPVTMIKIGLDYKRSQAGLEYFAKEVGPAFGCNPFSFYGWA